MRFQSHVPNSMSIDPIIPKQEFASISDLLNNSWIKSWNKGQSEFAYYWSPNNGQWSKALLMAKWKDKDEHIWRVLGYMDEIPTELSKMICTGYEEEENDK